MSILSPTNHREAKIPDIRLARRTDGTSAAIREGNWHPVHGSRQFEAVSTMIAKILCLGRRQRNKELASLLQSSTIALYAMGPSVVDYFLNASI